MHRVQSQLKYSIMYQMPRVIYNTINYIVFPVFCCDTRDMPQEQIVYFTNSIINDHWMKIE